MMDIYMTYKNCGRQRGNPDRNARWNLKVYDGSKSNAKHRREAKKNERKRGRRRVRDTDDKLTNRKVSSRKICEEPYRYHWAFNNMAYRRERRSGKYCKICEDIMCKHRATESALLVLLSHAHKDGSFAMLSRDIALIIAKKVYKTQMDWVDNAIELRNARDALWNL